MEINSPFWSPPSNPDYKLGKVVGYTVGCEQRKDETWIYSLSSSSK